MAVTFRKDYTLFKVLKQWDDKEMTISKIIRTFASKQIKQRLWYSIIFG